MNRPSFETLGLAAALALAGCNEGNGKDTKDSEVLDSDTAVDTATDTATDTDSGVDTGNVTDTDTDTDSGVDTATDTATGISEITTTSKVTCEALASTLMPDELSSTQFVESLGAYATYTGRTFQDTRFDAMLDDEVVGACLWNGEGTAADETRVIRVAATETDPATLTVEGEIDLNNGAVKLQFVSSENLWAAQDAEDTNPAWMYSAGAGEVDDLQYIAGTDNMYFVVEEEK